MCADHYTIGGLDPHIAFDLVQISAAPVWYGTFPPAAYNNRHDIKHAVPPRIEAQVRHPNWSFPSSVAEANHDMTISFSESGPGGTLAI